MSFTVGGLSNPLIWETLSMLPFMPHSFVMAQNVTRDLTRPKKLIRTRHKGAASRLPQSSCLREHRVFLKFTTALLRSTTHCAVLSHIMKNRSGLFQEVGSRYLQDFGGMGKTSKGLQSSNTQTFSTGNHSLE